MPAEVLVVGSINADLSLSVQRHPLPGETLTGAGGDLTPGGKGANQALAASRMGARTSLIGAIGNDAAAQAALALLHTSPVNLQGVTVVEEPTGLAVITVSSEGENCIIVIPGANSTVDLHRVTHIPQQSHQVVVTQGEIPAATVDALALAVKGRFVLNLAPVIPVAVETLRSANPLIVNEHEGRHALELFGPDDLPTEDRDVVAALRSHGVPSVVLTRGAQGAIVAEGQDLVTIDAPTVSVVDTTGAGDAFVGALVAGLADGDNLVVATRTAVRVGAFACTSAGAQESYPVHGDKLPST